MYIVECEFYNCKAEGSGSGNDGGAIMCNFGFVANAFAYINQCIFFNCTSKANGGAFYIICNEINANHFCVSNCSSIRNQAFMTMGNKVSLKVFSISSCGMNHWLKESSLFSTHGEHFIVNGCNASYNLVSGQCGILSSSYFIKIQTTLSLFINNEGENGFCYCDITNALIDFLSCQFIKNVARKGVLFNSFVQTKFFKSTFYTNDAPISWANSMDLFMFTQCNFDSTERILLQYYKQESLVLCNYGKFIIDFDLSIPTICSAKQIDSFEYIEEKTYVCKKSTNTFIRYITTLIIVLLCLFFISQRICVPPHHRIPSKFNI